MQPSPSAPPPQVKPPAKHTGTSGSGLAGCGGTLILIGVLSFVLPLLNIQFRLIQIVEMMGVSTEMAGLLFVVVGLVLVGIQLSRGNK